MKLKELINLNYRSIILKDKKASKKLFNYNLYNKMKRSKTALGKMTWAAMQDSNLFDENTFEFKAIK